jgi:hypothetical protein
MSMDLLLALISARVERMFRAASRILVAITLFSCGDRKCDPIGTGFNGEGRCCSNSGPYCIAGIKRQRWRAWLASKGPELQKSAVTLLPAARLGRGRALG